ncbi:hypothetical protein CFIO01_00920 [Colletotrichum fioriniae PJ7]|uniref:Uncharacterized protein n=1 Tax=Colletotrichum fioriniae PJ7 TaxID=1445577 RepID=A0A010RPW7_9PEZI|nr:hypothetical protein CFIO01_00920 [Colletotrichum fioriniae PJ7]
MADRHRKKTMTECERKERFDDRPPKVWHLVTEFVLDPSGVDFCRLAARTGQIPANKNLACSGHAEYFCVWFDLIGRLTDAAVREHYISEMVACVAGHG